MIQKKVILFFLLIQGIYSFAQVTFEKGYFITNADEKIECFIENLDWLNNPTNFKYKLTLNSELQTRTLENTKSFEIKGVSKYKRVEVDLNTSSDDLNNLTYDRNITYSKQTVFLNALIEGDASLYEYRENKLIRYFYTIANSAIQPLGYKVYKTSDEKIKKNKHYGQQLWNDLKCEGITQKNVLNTKYKQKDLVRFFIKYNDCKGTDIINFNEKSTKGTFAVSVRPGFGIGTISVESNPYFYATDVDNTPLFYYISKNVEFKNKSRFRLGVELEAFLPFNKNKFSVLFEPTYQSIKGEERYVFLRRISSNDETDVIIDYKSIELPVGVRYNMFFNDSSRLFFNGGVQLDIPLNSKIDFADESILDNEIDKISFGMALGIGFSYNNYNIEVRYLTPKNLLNGNLTVFADYSSFSLLFGYSIFNNRKEKL